MIVLIFAIGILAGLAIAAILDRLTAKAPATQQEYHGISAIGVNVSGRGGPEVDPRYARLVQQALEQPQSESGFRTLLP
jgi:hypothetical protein